MWRIVINGPGYFDTAYDLPDGVTHMGRAEENDVVLSGDLVSRRHARLRADGASLWVEDLGSRNGSRVNGEPLSGERQLRPGDTVDVGENTLAIRQPGSTETAETEMVVETGAAGGVRRYGRGSDIEQAVLMVRSVRESVVLRALDNLGPLDGGGPTETPVMPEGQLAYDSLGLLYKAAEQLAKARSLEEFLQDLADRVMARANGTTAVVMLRHAAGQLVPAVVRHRGELAQGEVPVSDAIIDAALEKGAALVVADVRSTRFALRESVVQYGAAQVLCVPLLSGARQMGVLYLTRPAGRQDELEPLLDLLTAVGHLVVTGVERFGAEERPRVERLRRTLERYHAPDIVERRLAELGRAGGGSLTQVEERTCTLVFADLAGFTGFMQRAGPEGTLELLNEFYERMTKLVFSYEGTVDKFVGDAVMALFGAPYARGDEALRAVRTALAMRDDWARAMERYPEAERCYLRIGVNTGRVLSGIVGSEARLDFTALGEPVNVAAWLAGTALPGQVLITGKTLAAVDARFDVSPLGERTLRPGREKVALFEVLSEDQGQHTSPGLK